MTLLFSIAVALVFGAGAFLLLERDLLRMAGGAVLVSHAANLFLMASGLMPARSGEAADPLVQALTLTAVVISFGVVALLVALVLRLEQTHETIDVKDVMAAERRAERGKGDVAEEGT